MDKNRNSRPETLGRGTNSEPGTPPPESRGGFGRRDLLKVITSVPVAALVPIPPALAQKPKATHPHPEPATPADAQPAGPYKPKVLNEHEWKTVTVLSEIIIPADERSGSAAQAGVPEFIDDWLGFTTGGGRMLPVIRGGLTWLDIECNRKFGHDFVDCSAAEKKQVLDRIAWPKQAALEDAPGAAFFTHLRNLVVSGFFSSKMGVRDLPYLGNTMVAEWNGCPSNVLARLGLDREGTKS